MAKIVYNNIIPFSGYQAMTIWPVIFARKRFQPLKEHVVNHESIHLRQQVEVGVTLLAVMSLLCLTVISWWWMIVAPFGYYALYALEYIIRLFAYGRGHEAYRNISFEQEAFLNERNYNYLQERKAFAWVKYFTRKTFKG